MGYVRCTNQSCEYYGIKEEVFHRLAVCGRNGRHEEIQDFKCQARGKRVCIAPGSGKDPSFLNSLSDEIWVKTAENAAF